MAGEAMIAKKRAKPSKYERLHELLGMFGNDLIDRDTFWRMMAEQNLTDADIDAYSTTLSTRIVLGPLVVSSHARHKCKAPR